MAPRSRLSGLRLRRRRHALAASVLAGALLVLAGCEGAELPYARTVPHVDTARFRADSVTWRHEVAAAPGAAALAEEELDRLDRFVARSGARAGETVTVSGGGAGAGDQRAAVAARLGRYGLEVVALAGVEGAPVTVSLRRRSYLPQACTGEPMTDLPNAESAPPLGCANAANLVRMVADPRDLERGRSTAGADGRVGAEAIERYRDDKVKPLLDYDMLLK